MEFAQFMIQEQDRAMDSIAGTLSTLAQQAGLMGQEIVEHNEQVISCPSPTLLLIVVFLECWTILSEA
jgi:hypothetical protein